MSTRKSDRGSPGADDPGPPERTFEQSLARLEEIVRELGRGTVPLEDSIRAFEEGSALVRQCLARLQAAEEKVQRLLAKSDGSFELTPLDRPETDAD